MRAQQMRVLRVIGGLDPLYGGPSESAANACIAAQRAGTDNTIAFPAAQEVLPRLDRVRGQLSQEGVIVATFPLSPITGRLAQRWGVSVHLALWLFRHVRHYDVVHVHGAWGLAPLAAVLAASSFGRPCVMTPHESLTGFDIEDGRNHVRPLAKKALRRLYLSRLSSLVFSSAIEARDSILPSEDVRFAVIPHPIRAALDAPRQSSQGSADTLTVGYLGRLHPKKNLEVLIQAVHAASPRARLLVAGDGSPLYRHGLKALSAQLGMVNRIEWLGFLDGDRRWAFLDTLDVLAMPSQYECFGMVGAEAMARGTPPVVSDRAGVAEVVSRHNCGLVAAPTVEGFAEALRKLERAPGLRATLAARGPVAARQELSLEGYGAALSREYEAVLTGSGSS